MPQFIEPAFPKRYNPTFDSGRFVLESPFSRWEEEDELRHREGLGPVVVVVITNVFQEKREK